MTAELNIHNARIVLRDEEIGSGTMLIRDGMISEVDRGKSNIPGEDFEGDYLLPGFVELHTDALERHISPRPKVRWPTNLAVLAHDAQICAAGITTVLDAISVGDVRDGATRLEILHDMIDGIETAQSQQMLRSEHFLHLRCEISFADLMQLVEPMTKKDWLRLVSIMDHTPGQRQFVSLEKYRQYYQGKFGLSDEEMDAFMTNQIAAAARNGVRNRRSVVDLCRKRGLPLASHDDATAAHVDQASADGMVVAEFPTTFEAAELSHIKGLSVMMGGPNLVRDGSHSGNIAARDLARRGHLDIISSDYVPFSLLQSVFKLTKDVPQISLPEAVAMVSDTPAKAVGLNDRGQMAPGLKADFLRVAVHRDTPVIKGVWRDGRRVI